MMHKPCASCPWRVDRRPDQIPNFKLSLAENLAESCPDENGMGPEITAAMFACHLSKVGEEFCWLARVGSAHPLVRLRILSGALSDADLAPGEDWPETHETYTEVLDKLRRTLCPNGFEKGEHCMNRAMIVGGARDGEIVEITTPVIFILRTNLGSFTGVPGGEARSDPYDLVRLDHYRLIDKDLHGWRYVLR